MSDAVRNFFAWALMIVGGLVAVLSGTCTVIFVGLGASDLLRGRGSAEDIGLLITFLFVGGVPFVVGAGLFVAGRALRKRR